MIVTCAIIIYQDKILAVRRPEGKSNGGLWEFPGGKPLERESFRNCIIREIQEELCLVINPSLRLQKSTYVHNNFHIELLPFVTFIQTDTFTLVEHSAHRWCSRSDIKELNWSPADIRIMEHVYNHFYSLITLNPWNN